MKVRSVLYLYMLIYRFLLTEEESQLKLLAESPTIIEAGQRNEELCGSYAITDLNHNGRLEIIFSNQQGTGRYSYNTIYEVNEQYNDVILYDIEYEWTESEADIAEEKEILTYYDENVNRYYYICYDYTRDGLNSYYYNKRAIYLEDYKIKSVPLAFMTAYFSIEKDAWEYEYSLTDKDTIINRETYENVEEYYFPNASKVVTTINWKNISDGEIFSENTREILKMYQESFEEFSLIY